MKVYRPPAGTHIKRAIEELARIAERSGESVKMEFNGTVIKAKPGASAASIHAEYEAEARRRHEAYQKSPQGKAAARRAKEEHERIEASLKAPLATFTLRDSDAWNTSVQANLEGYGRGIIRFAARWANIAEKKLSEGMPFDDAVKAASDEADDQGITGFMYGAAVCELARVWVLGEDLRRWHNLDTQLDREGEEANRKGGILNPALLRIK